MDEIILNIDNEVEKKVIIDKIESLLNDFDWEFIDRLKLETFCK